MTSLVLSSFSASVEYVVCSLKHDHVIFYLLTGRQVVLHRDTTREKLPAAPLTCQSESVWLTHSISYLATFPLTFVVGGQQTNRHRV